MNEYPKRDWHVRLRATIFIQFTPLTRIHVAVQHAVKNNSNFEIAALFLSPYRIYLLTDSIELMVARNRPFLYHYHLYENWKISQWLGLLMIVI